MLNKIEKSEEEKSFPIFTPKPNHVGFRPYHLVKSESMPIQNAMHGYSKFASIDQISQSQCSNTEVKQTRKRRRLSCERDLSPETFRKTRNKRLAKESRLRKGNYIKNLEDKIAALEK